MAMILFSAAIIPIVFLGLFIYLKDQHKEPKGLLALIFFMGALSVIPICIGEIAFDFIFPTDAVVSYGFVLIFINIFIDVALFEEGFKWLVTWFFGYRNESFDEIYDIIVYAVFASLGFACIENIGYVFQFGLGTAFTRALLSIPGHTCFAITMGYFFSKAKVGQLNGNKSIYKRNMILSILIPMVLHSVYDALLYNMQSEALGETLASMFLFFLFFIVMVVICFIVVHQTAKVQQNLVHNLKNGNISRNDQGVLYYNTSSGVNPNATVSVSPNQVRVISFCPICGKRVSGGNFCGRCGFRLK